MTGRETLAQGPPPPIAELPGFPVRVFPAGRRIFRAHAATAGPWWFGSAGFGRFDLSPPRGTCYLAESAVVAIRERLGTVLGGAADVPASMLDGAVVSTLELPSSVAAANLRAVAATRFGVLRELEVMVPYAIPHAWAHALADAGHDGIAYGARFTPGRAGALAWFGDEGARPDWALDPRPNAAVDIPGGPAATRRPRRAQLKVIQPPRARRRPKG